MQHGIYLNAAGALAAETRLDVIANNLANIDTPGFRKSTVVFQQRLAEALENPGFRGPSPNPVLDRFGGGVLVHEVSYDSGSGALLQTDEPLDLALEGDGWFTVSVGGENRFTRAGNFVRTDDGTLKTAGGEATVLDVKGRPVKLPEGVFSITEDGTIRSDARRVATLAIRGSVDPGRFVPVGSNLYRYVGDGEPGLATARIKQGFLEQSTVSPVREMVEMIRTFRAYEANQSMIRQQDEAFGRAVNDVGRVA